MRRHDPPALVGPHPDLALSSGPRRTLEFGVGGGEVPPVSGDDGLHEIAGQIGGRAAGAESGDLIIAVKVFGRSVAQGVRAPPKQRVELRDVVGDKRALVTGEGLLDLGDALREC